jgi:hypothetical protein
VRGGVLLWAVFTLVAVVAGLAAASSVGGAISGAASRPRTNAQIHAALARVHSSPAPTPSAPSGRSSPKPHHTTSGRPDPSPSGRPSSSTGAGPTRVGQTTSQPSPTATSGGSTGGRPPGSGSGGAAVRETLSSVGGTVVASCRATRVTLLTWSPGIGYRVTDVAAGPATVAQIVFEADGGGEASMVISCGSDGRPHSANHSNDGGNDGGSGDGSTDG